MDAFPAKARLAHVVKSLMKQLPTQMQTALEHERFAEDFAEVRRLLDTEYLSQAVQETTEQEAQWLAQLLKERWARVGDVTLGPAVAIVAPYEVWVGDTSREINLEIASLDLDEDWQAEWYGDVVPTEDKRSARLSVAPITDDAPVAYEIDVRVTGRHRGKRCIQSAHHQLKVRRPVLEISDDRLRLVVRDQSCVLGGGVEVDINGRPYVTQENGLLELSEVLGEAVVVQIGGVEL